MSKNRPHAVTTAIISHNVPVNREPYDPKELILDMPAAYHLAKSVLDDPKSGIEQKLKASQFIKRRAGKPTGFSPWDESEPN